MKLFVVLSLLAFAAVALAQPVAEQDSLSASPAAEEKEAVAPVAAAPAEGKDLDTANSYVYGYPYGGYYGGGYGGYGGYGLGYYGGYGGYGLGYGGYPYYGGYGVYY